MKSKYHNFSNKNIKNISKFKASEDEDDLGNILGKQNQLGYFSSQRASTCLTVHLDEDIKDAQYYRQVVQAINNTSEDDTIEFQINSPGGDLNGLLALLTALEKTEATSIAYINASAHSAASMLALNCNAVYVSPYASMLCHFISFSTGGKSTDIKSYVNHVHTTSETLFRDTYELFLTEEEIDRCIEGAEIWLDSAEINRRLTLKYEALEKMQTDLEALESQCQGSCSSCNESCYNEALEALPEVLTKDEKAEGSWPDILPDNKLPKGSARKPKVSKVKPEVQSKV